jgi:hypothetical protein
LKLLYLSKFYHQPYVLIDISYSDIICTYPIRIDCLSGGRAKRRKIGAKKVRSLKTGEKKMTAHGIPKVELPVSAPPNGKAALEAPQADANADHGHAAQLTPIQMGIDFAQVILAGVCFALLAQGHELTFFPMLASIVLSTFEKDLVRMRVAEALMAVLFMGGSLLKLDPNILWTLLVFHALLNAAQIIVLPLLNWLVAGGGHAEAHH